MGISITEPQYGSAVSISVCYEITHPITLNLTVLLVKLKSPNRCMVGIKEEPESPNWILVVNYFKLLDILS